MAVKMENETYKVGHRIRKLNSCEQLQLQSQNCRLVSEFVANKLEEDAKRNWDLFYKRNETRFFKDRHWTTREFCELTEDSYDCNSDKKVLLEVGCGVGNLVFPLIRDNLNLFIYACDFSPRAVEFVKLNPNYSEKHMQVFQADVTTDDLFTKLANSSVDIISLIFVLSAIHPRKFDQVLKILYQVLKPGGIILFRDYGLYDMAQLRFKSGHKISENLYMRQDGTRSFYFSEEYCKDLFERNSFQIVSNSYIERRTVNKKEGIDVPRIFIQTKCRKPLDNSSQQIYSSKYQQENSTKQ